MREIFGEITGEEPVEDVIMDISDILYFDNDPMGEIDDAMFKIRQKYPDAIIERADDDIHGSRRVVKITNTSEIQYIKNLALAKVAGQSLHLQHAMRAGRPCTDRVIKALQLARVEHPELWKKGD